MRRAVFGLLALAGCNQIFGLDPSVLADEDSKIRLTIEVSSTRREDGSPGEIAYEEIVDKSEIKIGDLLGGDLSPATYGADQQIGIAKDVFAGRWRLVYPMRDETLPRDEAVVVREVQWQPQQRPPAHFIDPQFRPPASVPIEVPADSGFALDVPDRPPTAPRDAVGMFTTGSWTEYRALTTTPIVNYNFPAVAHSLSGPLSFPRNDRGDLGILIDYDIDYDSAGRGCRYSIAVTSFQVPPRPAMGLTPVVPGYDTRTGRQVVVTTSGTPFGPRLADALQTRAAPGGGTRPKQQFRWEYGYLPAPTFAFSRPGSANPDEFLLPRPRMIELAECKYPDGAMIVDRTPTPVMNGFVDSVDLGNRRFPAVVHFEVADTRITPSGASLSSGFAIVALTAQDTSTQAFIDVPVPAAIAPITLERGAQAVQLAGDEDDVLLPAGNEPFTLRFALEVERGLYADFFDIVLYSIADRKLHRERIYTVADIADRPPNMGGGRFGPDVVIHPADLKDRTEYVLAITSYRGTLFARRDDFTANTFPQSAATVFTRTFKKP